MKKIFLIALISINTGSFLFSQESKEDIKYKQKFIEYMNLTKIKENFLNSTLEALEENKKTPNAPKEQIKFLDDFILKIKEITQQEIVDIFMPPHKSNFTYKELDKLVKFYSTPIGKKYSEKQNEILNEVKKNSEKYGLNIANEIMKKYESEANKPAIDTIQK